MPTDIETMVLRIEASAATYERSMAKVQALTEKAAGAVETRAAGMSKRVNDSLTKAGSGFETANIAAQFQDIAVSLASGQNPFTVALQQGSQLSAVLGNRGLSGAVAAVGTAFASLLSPVNLALFAILGLGGAAVSYFVGGKSDAERLDEELKKHGAIIASLKDRYGEAAAGVREYAQQSGSVLAALARVNAERLREELSTEAKKIRAELDGVFSGVGVSIDTGSSLRPLEGDYRRLADAAAAFAQSVKSGTPQVEAFREVLSRLLLNSTDDGIRQTAREMLDLTSSAGNVERALTAADNAVRQAVNAVRGVGLAASASAGQIGEFSSALMTLRGVAATLKPAEQAAEALKKALASSLDAKDAAAAMNEYGAAMKRIAAVEAERGAKKGPNEYQTAIRSSQERVATLEAEAAALGKGRLAEEQAKIATELDNAAKRAGVALTAEVIAANQRQAATEAQRIVGLEQQKKRIDELAAAMDAIKSTAGSTLGTFLNDVAEGTKASEALKTAIDGIRSALINAFASRLMNYLLSALFPTPGGMPIPFLPGGARAGGGSVQPGRSFQVGEHGPETFVPTSPGRIVPAGRTGGGGITISTTNDFRGADPSAIPRLLMASARQQRQIEAILGSQTAQRRGTSSR